jgi:hypothetical protein
MIWLWVIGALVLGMVIGFCLGVAASRALIEDQRKKALEMATLLIETRRGTDERQVVHTPSISLGTEQQFLYEVIFGGGDGTEEQVSRM